MRIHLISKEEVKLAVSMKQAIETVSGAFAQLSRGNVSVPIRTHLSVTDYDGLALFMPGYLKQTNELGVKMVSVYSNNLKLGIPTINALVTLLDAQTGVPTAVIEGTYLTALRTGAASGVATDLLARTNSKSVAILGAGVQARTQLLAVCAVRSIEKVSIFDNQRAAAELFGTEMAEIVNMDINVADSAATAIANADVVCTATTSSEPVFEHSDLMPGTHVNAIGSFTPQMQELPSVTVKEAKLIVDSREAAWAESGDLIIPRSEGLISEKDVYGELGEIVNGDRLGRTTDDEITLFKSVGNAVQDVAVAGCVLAQVKEKGLGTVVEL